MFAEQGDVIVWLKAAAEEKLSQQQTLKGK
jgi:hypothetical protein